MTTYTITLTDGTILTTIAPQTVDTSHSSLTLWGQGEVNYGQLLHNNAIHIVENFSNNTSPSNPLVGQLWYDSAYNVCRVWNGTVWVPTSSARLSSISTNVATPVGTTEVLLQQYTIPALTYKFNNQVIKITACGTMNANTNFKSIRMYFGSDAVLASTSDNTAIAWKIESLVILSGASTQIRNTTCALGSNLSSIATNPTQNSASPILVKVTGQSAIGTLADIACNFFMVEFVP